MGRIYTIVGRDNTVMTCDSLTGKATYKKYESTTIGALYSVLNCLKKIEETDPTLREDRYAILIPDCINGLYDARTTNYWMQHRKSKSGHILSLEFILTVVDIVSYLNDLKNVKILTASKMYRGVYADNVSRAWATLNKIVPKQTDKPMKAINMN